MADEPSDGSEKDRNAPTVRDLKGPTVSADTIPDLIGQYVPPRTLPEATRHRTIDVKPVRLSAEADPRQARTERRLMSPALPERRRSRAWLMVLVILLAVGVWALILNPWSPSAVVPASPTLRSPATASVAALPLTPPPPATALAAPDRSGAPLASISNVATPPPAPSVAPKATSPRETTKKRKDPWLE